MLLVSVVVVNLIGCSKMEVQTKDLTEGVSSNQVKAINNLDFQNIEATDFAIRLFKACEEKGKNTLISPLSVMCALSMTANGAKEETLQQMEEVLGMTTNELNLYIYSYMKNLPQDEKYKLSLANSIWFNEKEQFKPNQDFLQTNADYYKADIYKASFNEQTLEDINRWVKDNTDGMIDKILDNISDTAIMYIVNALTFEAEWMEIYEKQQVRAGEFTREDGIKQDVDFMYGSEGIYLESENAVGFKKYYKDGKYAFVAMLPNEGVSVSDYIESLSGESLNELLSNPQNITVHTSIPKFETEYDVEMVNILKGMGMTEAFDVNAANFKGLGTSANGNIYISRVIHKTFISVNEKGTKAGAATVVEMSEGAALLEEYKEVYLNRPFVYMLIDCENNIPFFVGTMMSVE